MKMTRRTTIKSVHGHAIMITRYLNISKRSQRKLVNRLHKKSDGQLFVSKDNGSFLWPSTGVEIIRSASRDVLVLQSEVTFKGKAPHQSLYPFRYCEVTDTLVENNLGAQA